MHSMTSFFKAAAVGLGLSLASLAGATVITFDEFGGTAVGTKYDGLSWNNLYTRPGGNHTSGGYSNAVVSGQYTTYNGSADDVVLNSSLFDFNGVFLTAAWNDNLNIAVTGSQSGLVLYSETVVVNTSGPTWFNFNFFGIDNLRFDSFGGTANAAYAQYGQGEHFAMDNFTYNEPRQSVPAPSPLALLTLGLVGLFGARRAKY